MQKETREQVYARLSAKYRTKWLNEAIEQQKTPAQQFAEKIGLDKLYDGEDVILDKSKWTPFDDIDNGKDITDYSDSEGGEVIVN